MQVYDHDELTKDDFLGEVSLDLSELAKQDTMEHKLKLVIPKTPDLNAGHLMVGHPPPPARP